MGPVSERFPCHGLRKTPTTMPVSGSERLCSGTWMCAEQGKSSRGKQIVLHPLILAMVRQQIPISTNQASQSSPWLMTVPDRSKDVLGAAIIAQVEACSDLA